MANDLINKTPEIRLTLSLDGKIKEVDIVADCPEDRDAALAKLRQFLPAVELLEGLAAKETGDE